MNGKFLGIDRWLKKEVLFVGLWCWNSNWMREEGGGNASRCLDADGMSRRRGGRFGGGVGIWYLFGDNERK